MSEISAIGSSHRLNPWSIFIDPGILEACYLIKLGFSWYHYFQNEMNESFSWSSQISWSLRALINWQAQNSGFKVPQLWPLFIAFKILVNLTSLTNFNFLFAIFCEEGLSKISESFKVRLINDYWWIAKFCRDKLARSSLVWVRFRSFMK